MTKAQFKVKDIDQPDFHGKTKEPAIKKKASPNKPAQSKTKKLLNKTGNKVKKSIITDKYNISGGSFGLKGKLVVCENNFNVFSTQEVQFNRDHIQDIVLNKGKSEKKFSVVSFILGFIVTIILSFFGGIVTFGIGGTLIFAIGMIISVAASFYTSKDKDIGIILLKDGKKLEVTGPLERLLKTS